MKQDLVIDAGCDFQAILTLYSSDLAQVDVSAATSVTFTAKVAPTSTPLITLTALPLGIAPPSPVGLFATGQAGFEELGTSPFIIQGLDEALVVARVANVAALEALPTTGFASSNLAFVATGGPVPGGTYYQWSLADARTPNGSTIVSGNGGSGNWLLFGTATITVPASVSSALIGWDRTEWSLLVGWSDGTTSKVFDGTLFVRQP